MANRVMVTQTSLSQSMEDYLETIMLIAAEQEVVRVKDVAAKMGVKKPSVVSALKALSERGLLLHEHYGYIKLTPGGMQVAQGVYAKHRLLFEFFTRVLGVDEQTADHDACMIEHYIGDQTRERLLKFIEFVRRYPEEDREAPWLLNFRHYLETGEVKLCESRVDKETT